MADTLLRNLERRALDGDLEAQARWLRQRVRCGELTEGRLGLAAYLGHKASRLVLGPDAREAPPEFRQWSHELEIADPLTQWTPWAQETFARAALAAAHAAHPEWERVFPEDDRPLLALDALRRWIHQQDDERVRASAIRAGDALWKACLEHTRVRRIETDRSYHALQAAASACAVASSNSDALPGTAARALLRAAAAVSSPEIKSAVTAALLPWALGLAKPATD